MTTPITKEQLIEHIKGRKEFADECAADSTLHPERREYYELTSEALRIALAAMDAEPIYQVWDDGKWCDYEERLWRELYDEHSANMFRIVYTAPPAPVVNAEPVADVVAWHKEGEERTCDIRWRRFDVAPGPLFAVAQPVEVVPDEMAISDDMNLYQKSFAQDHNTRRAAILNHSVNERDMVERVSQPYKLPATRFQQVADLYGITSPTGSETSFTFDAFEASSFAKGGWSVQEYVELERYQQAVVGNSPVIPDGWIAVSERVPEEDGNYWGWWSESNRQGPVWFIKSDLQAQFQSSEITHWMPLPAAPQQEGK
ncbi:DUF551 domain-containing protein [Pseudocitrobacter faecalis]|uniref:DUF551 domain-containing protein n=1 Tax=Pseudocitrobacter faecalis TaxID=1398493 RepID=UPI0039EF7CD9